MQRQDVLAQQPGQCSARPASAPRCRRSGPCRCAATAPARASTRSNRPSATTTAARTAVQTTGRARWTWAPQGKAWLAVQSLEGTEAYTRAGALRGQHPRASSSHLPACPCWVTAGPIAVPAGNAHARGGQPTAPSPPPPPAAGRDAGGAVEARHARGASRARGTDGLFRAGEAPTSATCRPIRPRACRAVRWKAATSARWRRWFP